MTRARDLSSILAADGSLNISTSVNLADNEKAYFGTSNDLQIYHDGSNSYISDVGTGNLFLGATNLFLRSGTGETYLGAIQDGAVSLYHDNGVKLATTATGVDVTGTRLYLTNAGNTELMTTNTNGGVTGGIQALSNQSLRLGTITNWNCEMVVNNAVKGTWSANGLELNGSNNALLAMRTTGDTDSQVMGTQYLNNSGAVTAQTFATGNSTSSSIFRIKAIGAIDLIGGDIGVTAAAPDLRVDSSGNVGIGTTSPTSQLSFGANIGRDFAVFENAGGANKYGIGMSGDGSGGNPYRTKIYANGVENVSITSAGNVGIGTISPSDALTVSTSAVNGGVTVSGSTDPQYFLNSSGGNQARFKINDASSMIQTGSWTNIPVGFYTNGTERMRIDTAGRVTMPYQPAFTVYTTASTSVSNIIQFGGVQFNVGSHFNTSTGVFTAPVAGKYWFYWHLLTDRTTNIGEGYIDLYKNSAYHYRNYEYKEASGNTHVEFKGGVILDMAANDTVHLYYGYTVFGNIIANFHHCKFSGHLIG